MNEVIVPIAVALVSSFCTFAVTYIRIRRVDERAVTATELESVWEENRKTREELRDARDQLRALYEEVMDLRKENNDLAKLVMARDAELDQMRAQHATMERELAAMRVLVEAKDGS